MPAVVVPIIGVQQVASTIMIVWIVMAGGVDCVVGIAGSGVVVRVVSSRWVKRAAGNPTPRMGHPLALSTVLPVVCESADASSIRGHRRPAVCGIHPQASFHYVVKPADTVKRGGLR